MSNEFRKTIQKKQTCIGQTYAKITGLCIDTFVWTVPKSVGCTIIMVHPFASFFIVLISIEEKKVAWSYYVRLQMPVIQQCIGAVFLMQRVNHDASKKKKYKIFHLQEWDYNFSTTLTNSKAHLYYTVLYEGCIWWVVCHQTRLCWPYTGLISCNNASLSSHVQIIWSVVMRCIDDGSYDLCQISFLCLQTMCKWSDARYDPLSRVSDRLQREWKSCVRSSQGESAAESDRMLVVPVYGRTFG